MSLHVSTYRCFPRGSIRVPVSGRAELNRFRSLRPTSVGPLGLDAASACGGGFEPQPTKSALGFALIEIMVALVILVLAAAVVIPAVSKTGIAQLRESATKVAGTVRATYNSAALGGRTHRLAIDLEEQKIHIEANESTEQKSKGLLGLASAFGNVLGTPSETPGSGDNAPQSEEDIVFIDPPAEVMRLMGMTNDDDEDQDSKQRADGYSRIQPDLVMPTGIRLMDVWVFGMDKPASKGTIYIPFYPGGYTEPSIIHLTNEEGVVFSIKIAGLTGATEIVASYVEASS